jgi:hypothetical protein
MFPTKRETLSKKSNLEACIERFTHSFGLCFVQKQLRNKADVYAMQYIAGAQ